MPSTPQRTDAPMARTVVDTDPARTLRLRRMAERQGLKFHKSRTRDPHALDYGKYWLTDVRTTFVVFGELPGDWRGTAATLDDIERYLTEG